jgi:hypothetical protein
MKLCENYIIFISTRHLYIITMTMYKKIFLSRCQSCVPALYSYNILHFLAHLAKGHVSFCHQVSSVVSFSHFNLLLRKHWANLDQTWMALFQNCVRQLCRPSKMATITKNRNFSKWPKLLNLRQFKPLWGKATRVKLIKYLKIFFRTINQAIFGVEHW